MIRRTPTRATYAALFAFALACGPSPFPASGQEQEPECRWRCEVVLAKGVSYGDADNGAIGWNHIIVRQGNTILASHNSIFGEIQVFSEDGPLIRRIGKPGPGPEEITGVSDMELGPDGNLWVFDGGALQLKVLTPEGEVIRTFPASFRYGRGHARILPDSSIILNALVPQGGLVGLWTHRWHPELGFMWSAENPNPVARARVEEMVFAVDGDEVWVARMTDEYLLERRRLADGQLLSEYRPVRTWFQEFSEPPRGWDRSGDDLSLARPEATITDLRMIDGRLWVLGYTGAEDWDRAREDGFLNLGTLLDNVIDIYDPETGNLLVSTRIDLENTLLHRFLDDQTIAAQETNPVVDFVTLYQIRLEGPVPDPHKGGSR